MSGVSSTVDVMAGLSVFLWCRPAAESLEAALNTLSRALESNCEDPEVWSHYLLLFSRRGSREEVQEMCEMAVEHAPDYRVWWNVSRLSVFIQFHQNWATLGTEGAALVTRRAKILETVSRKLS